MRTLLALLAAAALLQQVSLYRARHRPAAELAPLAESALGAGGRVTVDARTASLVLRGSPEAVARALALLRQLDRALSSVVIQYQLVGESSLETAGLQIEWSGTTGRVISGAQATLAESRFQATLRVLEGDAGLLLTGRSRALPGSGVVLSGESGFEAVPTLLEGGRVHLEVRPFDGRLVAGGVRYTAAATALELWPGETLVIGELRGESESRQLAPPGGAAGQRMRERQLLLLRLEVEP